MPRFREVASATRRYRILPVVTPARAPIRRLPARRRRVWRQIPLPSVHGMLLEHGPQPKCQTAAVACPACGFHPSLAGGSHRAGPLGQRNASCVHGTPLATALCSFLFSAFQFLLFPRSHPRTFSRYAGSSAGRSRRTGRLDRPRAQDLASRDQTRRAAGPT